MRVGFVETEYFSSREVTSWSGLPYFMAQALRHAGAEVIPVPLTTRTRTWPALARTAAWRLLRRRHLRDRHPSYLRALAAELAAHPLLGQVDVLFAPSTLPFAAQRPARPAFAWTDATFPAMLGRYPSFSGLDPASARSGLAAERLALGHLTRTWFASTWAQSSAQALCPEVGERAHLLRFGPNLATVPTSAEVETFVADRLARPPRALFLGVDWVRKGGAQAVEVVVALRARGISAELDVVGCPVPPDLQKRYPWIKAHGFVSKQDAAGQARLSQFLREARWLLLPSEAECFGVVFVEAAAYGLPSLARAVDGVPSAVAHGESGWLFPPSESATAWADTLLNMDEKRYQALGRSARAWYEREATWAGAGRTLVAAMQEALPGRPQRS